MEKFNDQSYNIKHAFEDLNLISKSTQIFKPKLTPKSKINDMVLKQFDLDLYKESTKKDLKKFKPITNILEVTKYSKERDINAFLRNLYIDYNF